MTTQQTVITAIKKVLDKGDIECPLLPARESSLAERGIVPFLPDSAEKSKLYVN
jgi:hypothetical protein